MTLSLFLMMGTLIILVPFTSITFPNVKAQEYGTYDNDMYSKYPTEIKKYECQKGPFEGFFVGSVEFCKKIPVPDNSGGNNGNGGGNGTVGPQGEPGPAGAQGEPGPAGQAGQQGIPGVSGPSGPRGLSGPAGPQGIQGERGFNGIDGVNGTPGPQGPAGFTEINDTNLYYVEGNAATTNGDIRSVVSSTANCQVGDIVIEGGYTVTALFTDTSPPLVHI